MAYYVGDIPAEDIVLEPVRGVDPIDLAPFTTAETVLRDFEGEEVPADFLALVDSPEGYITIEWPATTVFADPGLYQLEVTLVGDAAQERLAPVYFVAQDDTDGWHTLDSARTDWSDAPSGDDKDDARLFQLLELAKEQCLEYAPALELGQRPPANYRGGQLMQARNLLNAGLVDPQDGSTGTDTFVLRPYPLDWTIKQMLRPKRAVPVVG